MAKLYDDVKVIDADTHFTEPPDLWTSRAPAAYKDRILHIEERNGVPTWVVDDVELGFAKGGGVVDHDGGKIPFLDSMRQGHRLGSPRRVGREGPPAGHGRVRDPRPGAVPERRGARRSHGSTPSSRTRRCGCCASRSTTTPWPRSRRSRTSGSCPCRSCPRGTWTLCVKETQRCAGLGLRGINMTSDPQDLGSPDLANRAWDPLWEVCADLDMPVHFHIGSSNTAMDFYGNYFWASQDEYVKPAIGGAMLFLNSARVVINTVFAGIFDRFPTLQMVAVESGVGWIPFILETMNYELLENAPKHAAELSKLPSEYFRSNWYATFWFEEHQGDVQGLLDKVGEDRVLFETDFPHPTCLYPSPLETVADKMSALRPETRRRVMGENAARLYRL